MIMRWVFGEDVRPCVPLNNSVKKRCAKASNSTRKNEYMISVGDLHTPLSVIDRSNRQRIRT